MADEYASLKNVAWQYRVLGWLVGIAIAVLALSIIYDNYITWDKLGREDTHVLILSSVLISLGAALIIWLEVATFRACSEFIYLCIRVEHNTRVRPQTPVVYQSPPPQMGYTQETAPQPELNVPQAQQPSPHLSTHQPYSQPTQEAPQQYTQEQPEYYMPQEGSEEQ